MPDAEPPSRVVRLPPTRAGSRRATPPTLPEVTRRLAALERQVDAALAQAGDAATALPPLETVLDGVLAGTDRVRRALGGDAEAAARLLAGPFDLLYRWWWRVDVVGLERLPRRGPVLVVANRAPAVLPWEAAILARALARDGLESRWVRPLLDAWVLGLPVLGATLGALGALPATAAAARRVLDAGEIAVAFPEGLGAIAKRGDQRYRLAGFRQAGALRAASQAQAPIVPVAVVGAEEAQPVLWRVERLGRLLGLPALPITPALVPLPIKWTIHVGEPFDPPRRGAGDRRAVRALAERVRERLQGLLSDGVGRRPGLFE